MDKLDKLVKADPNEFIVKWIRADYDLPEDATDVLATCFDDVEMCLFHNDGNYAWFEFNGEEYKATHWMPKPKPAN